MSKSLRFGIILLVLLCLFLFATFIIDIPADRSASGSPVVDEAPPPMPETSKQDMISAVDMVLETAIGKWEIFDYEVDHIQVQDDGKTALVWLAAIEPETGELLGREPELALAELGSDGNWQVLLEDDEKFADIFKSLQYAEKSIQGDLEVEPDITTKSTTVYGGYYLPWAAGLEKRLTWSVAHSSCHADWCYYAFDFADGTMFPLMAAKGGTVYHWKDSCANYDTYCTNSITLQDRSTTPWTYQIYMHLANNSIPSHLKQVGTPVLQGQFIGNVDDTGYSSGHHVHFMVVTEDTRYLSGSGYIFGKSVDITFRDVDINWHEGTQGGRPRLQYEADIYGGEGRRYYISGNEPANPPTGGLTAPATKTYITTPQLTVSGWGQDDIAVVKYEILAKYADAWTPIKEVPGGDNFTTTVNLCSTNIPNGPVKLALRVWDYEGNPSGVLTPRKLIKNVECSTTGTNPSVGIIKNGGVLALPQTGFVSATPTKGTTGSNIVSIEFWFHGRNWTTDNWVYLGKDTNGSNGWQAAINTVGMAEGNNYTIVAVVTDALGKKGVDVSFQGIIDKTPPWINFQSIQSPYLNSTVTLNWTGGDNLSGVDYYALNVSINSNGLQVLERSLPRTANSYQFTVAENQLVLFELLAYDRSGNKSSKLISLYTNGYEFPLSYNFPFFTKGN